MKIAHIICPVKVAEKSDLFLAQPITFESIRRAHLFCKGEVDVELYTIQYPEDRSIIPDFFTILPDLKRSVYDEGVFEKKRKLPLIADILDGVYNASDAEYIIFSNADIAVMPQFYQSVNNILAAGIDGCAINRRTISGHYTDASQLPLMYSEVGKIHGGYDCFVFKRSSIPSFELGKSCTGANWSGRIMITNVIRRASRFRVFGSEKLTFHIGDDTAWKNPVYKDYDDWNCAELRCNVEKMQQEEVSEEINKYFKEVLYEVGAFGEEPDSSDLPHLSQEPIFIAGYPRSGTTLLQALLLTQDNLFSLPETHFFSVVTKGLPGDRAISSYLLNRLRQKVKECMHFDLSEELYHKLNQKIWYGGGVFKKELFEALVADYCSARGVGCDHDVRWLEKTPSHALQMYEIIKLYPAAKFVYVMRNPNDVLASCHHNLGEYAKSYEQLLNEWEQFMEAAIFFKARYPHNICIVSYEELLANQTAEMNDICDFCDLAFDPSTLKQYPEKHAMIVLPHEKWKNGILEPIKKRDRQLPVVACPAEIEKKANELYRYYCGVLAKYEKTTTK